MRIACLVALMAFTLSGASPTFAQPAVPDSLREIAAALDAVRAVKATNADRDAGPELTPVKQALRAWIESRLPPPQKPGRIEGSIDVPDSRSLAALAKTLSDELDEAHLTCGDFNTPTYRCSSPKDGLESYRGTVGAIELGTLNSGTTQYLMMVTGVGVLCGYDESAYLYAPDGDHWKLVFASEQDDYRKDVYTVQEITEMALSPEWTGSDGPSKPPLIATLGYGPWCSSTWSSLFTRLWRVAPGTTTPKPLLERSDGMWWGDEDFGSAELTDSSFLIEHTDASMDTGVHSRPHVWNYRVGTDDRLERVDPVALRPMDFVDEWLSAKWPEASHWIDGRTNRSAFRKAHKEGRAEFADTGKRCRGDRSLWQVVLVGGRHFEVRWSAPYVFRLVAVSPHAFAGCNLDDPLAVGGTGLFPPTGWRPWQQ